MSLSNDAVDTAIRMFIDGRGPVNGWKLEWLGFMQPSNRFIQYGIIRATKPSINPRGECLFACVPEPDDWTIPDFPVFRKWNLANWTAFQADPESQMREFESVYDKFTASLT